MDGKEGKKKVDINGKEEIKGWYCGCVGDGLKEKKSISDSFREREVWRRKKANSAGLDTTN